MHNLFQKNFREKSAGGKKVGEGKPDPVLNDEQRSIGGKGPPEEKKNEGLGAGQKKRKSVGTQTDPSRKEGKRGPVGKTSGGSCPVLTMKSWTKEKCLEEGELWVGCCGTYRE